MNIEEQQEQVQKRENESDENNNAYSLFLYGMIPRNKGLLSQAVTYLLQLY